MSEISIVVPVYKAAKVLHYVYKTYERKTQNMKE